MPSPQNIYQLRTGRDTALTAAIAAENRVRALDTAIAQAQRAGSRQELARLQQARQAAAAEAKRSRADHARLGKDAFGGLVGWLAQTPEEIVATCSDGYPFVLLPVRIETKFAQTATGTELRVRFYPDDISIAAPPSAMTDAERTLGEAYWRARAAAKLAPADDSLRRAYEGAWTTLATRAGAYRAGYVIRVTAPANPDAAPESLVFSNPAPPVDPPVPRADLLPDRFVVLTYVLDPATQQLRQAGRAMGAPIPDDLMLAPDASEPDSWITRDEASGRLVVPDGLKWMVDFDAAVSVGMGLRMPLAAPYDASGFDRVIAIGLRSATPPEASPAALEKLLSKHRYGAGCALLRSGTPTNNTDSAVSGWQPPSGDLQQLFAIEDAPPDITAQDGLLGQTDGRRLADLFGLSDEFVRRLPNAAATDVAEALAMNHAAAPGTVDDFVGEFLKSLVAPETASNLHGFFLSWVSGRGLYPALRVGRQPYGIVVTSAWNRWRFPAGGAGPLFTKDVAPALFDLIGKHRGHWEALARSAPHAAQTGGDAFQRLLGILGLLASSSEYASRKAISDEYIRQRLSFGGADAAATQAWFDELRNARAQSLSAIGFPPPPGGTDPLLAFIVFLDETDGWRLPLVDRDPKVPLSESSPIAPYDGTRNYLQWLAQAARADLTSERFLGADGTSIAPPTALLYILLRHALLTAIESASLDAGRLFGSQFFDVIDRDPLIANIGSEQHILRKDYLEVDAARLGLAKKPIAVADWALETARQPDGAKPAPAQRVAEVNDAIGALAGLPTARLERLLAEHIDLCSYRLDAWITALYSQRLAQVRAQAQARGLYLGAFGWVENLRPATATRRRLSVDELPSGLRDVAGANVFEDTTNGGYVHAPSLMQAATASVLRNGYLSHASSGQPLPFAVNLSSARMRQALALTEGVRGGQPIAALLGYQFERGLHERHPGVELDQYIYTLRDRFPLLSGRLTDVPAGTSAEVIEARNVVDGLDLLGATAGQAYPYGIDKLPAAGTPAAEAIAAEIDLARDALDAVSDLLLAESVHQAVQGNLARTQASLQALTAPEAPPEPEVIRTPRSGRVLTFRAALALDAGATAGWTAALSPRARANPQLNHWLAAHLPPPASIQWAVQNGGAPASVESFAGLTLEPVDIVLMSGDRLGDQSSELERFVIRSFRRAKAVPDERATIVAPAAGPIDPSRSVVFDFGVAGSGHTSLAALQPLLARFRRLITRARAAHAADWRRAADQQQADPADPTGSAAGDPKLDNFKDLTDRLDAASAGLTAAVDDLKAKVAAVAPLLASLDADPNIVNDPAWPARLEDLRGALFAIAPYGIPEAVPADGLSVSRVLIDRIIGQAQAVIKIGEQRLARGAQLRATAFPDPLPPAEPARSKEIARRNDVLRQSYIETAKTLLGPSFVIVPLFHFHPDQANELQQAVATPVTSDPVVMESWLHSAARVRPRLADLTWTLAGASWIDRAIADPAVLQLPHQPGTPWIGSRFGPDLPQAEWLSLLVLDAAPLSNPLQAGLLIDDWTETVPTDRETTGIAFNFDRPNAVAPQAVLVAVAPELRGHWEWDDVIGSVHEALDLAKLRAVEPDALIGRNAGETSPKGDYFQALPAILSEFTSGRLAVTDFAARVATALAQMKA